MSVNGLRPYPAYRELRRGPAVRQLRPDGGNIR